MKLFRYAVTFYLLLLAEQIFAQQFSAITLMGLYPHPGQKIAFTYVTNDTAFMGKKNLTALVYYLDGKNYPVDEIIISSASSDTYKGEFILPDSAKAFVIKIKNGDNIDNNNGKGYTYILYEGEKPAKGAYGQVGYIRMSHKSETRPHDIDLAEDFEDAAKNYELEFKLHPDSIDLQDMLSYGYALSRMSGYKANPEQKKIVEEKVQLLRKSQKQQDFLLASELLTMVHDRRRADSVETVSREKFPQGTSNKKASYFPFLRDNSTTRRDTELRQYVKKYGMDSQSDFFAEQTAVGYLLDGQFDKFNGIKRLMKDTGYLITMVNNVAEDWARKGEHLPQAEMLAKEAVGIMQVYLDKAVSEQFLTLSQVRNNLQSSYDRYYSVYNYVLFKEGKLKDVIGPQRVLYEHNKYDASITRHYLEMLVANKNYTEARRIAETARLEQEFGYYPDILLQCYVQLHGNKDGYQHYTDSLRADKIVQKRKEIIDIITINKQAPAFTLKDMDLKDVSLADFKGKTVVLAFWASWQYSSVPYARALHNVINRYSNDPCVVFLFINHMVSGGDLRSEVRDTLKHYNYDFKVLFDHTPDNKYDQVTKLYNAMGGQSVYIIDKNGNIRINGLGYDVDYTTKSYEEDLINLISEVETGQLKARPKSADR